MTYQELCQDKRVQERFKGRDANWCFTHKSSLIIAEYEYSNCCPHYADKDTDDIKQNACKEVGYKPTFDDLWQWWMEVIGMDWITCHCEFGSWLSAQAWKEPNNGKYITSKYESLEHALLACILEKKG